MASQPAAPPATETTTSTSPPPPAQSQSQSQPALYFRFHAYPFATDDEYQAGLSSILGHPGTPTTAAELDANPGLILNAKLFYFAQKHSLAVNAIHARGYVDWLRMQTGTGAGTGTGSESGTQQQQQQQQQQTEAAQQQQDKDKEEEEDDDDDNNVKEKEKEEEKGQQEKPPYPSSFQAIIDLITSNKPVPGIEQIPDTVLEHGSSKVDRTPRRKKPWEKDGEEEEAAGDGDSGDAKQQTSIVPGETDEHSADKPVQTEDGLLRILQPNAIPPSGLLANND